MSTISKQPLGCDNSSPMGLSRTVMSIRDQLPKSLRGTCEDIRSVISSLASGGGSLALQLARWPATRSVWTGSCPCQPFSAAGKGDGIDDERHLWPVFFELIRQGEPETVFGEQVASSEVVGSRAEAAFLVAVQAGDYARANKIAKQLSQSSAFHYHSKWLDGVLADLESAGYAVGASVLGAHSAGAPHIRQRLYWVAHAKQPRREAAGLRSEKHPGRELEQGCTPSGLGESNGDRWEPGQFATEAAGHGDTPQPASGGRGRVAQPHIQHDDRSGSCTGDDSGEQPGAPILCQQPDGYAAEAGPSNHWGEYHLIPCRDGKLRRIPTEPALFPLADGLSYKLGARRSVRPALLHGAGNAIVPEVAALFIEAFSYIIDNTTTQP